MANNIDRPNAPSPDVMKDCVRRIENINKEIASKTGEFMKSIAGLKEDVKSILDEAKGKGIPKAALKGVIKARDLERKVIKIREDLEDDQLDIYVSIREALGDYADLPLGAHAVVKEEAKQDPATAAIVAAVQNAEENDAAAEAEKQAKIAEQRERDGVEFDVAEKGKADTASSQGKPAEVLQLDPAAARKARQSGGKFSGKVKESAAAPAPVVEEDPTREMRF